MVFSVGNNEYGQLGQGDNFHHNECAEPLMIKILLDYKVKDIYAGANHNIVYGSTRDLSRHQGNTDDNESNKDVFVYTWGDNRYGQCGYDKENAKLTLPEKLSFFENVCKEHGLICVTGTSNASFVFCEGGLLYGFGDNSNGVVDPIKDGVSCYYEPYLVNLEEIIKQKVKVFDIMTSANSIMLLTDKNSMVLYGKIFPGEVRVVKLLQFDDDVKLNLNDERFCFLYFNRAGVKRIFDENNVEVVYKKNNKQQQQQQPPLSATVNKDKDKMIRKRDSTPVSDKKGPPQPTSGHLKGNSLSTSSKDFKMLMQVTNSSSGNKEGNVIQQQIPVSTGDKKAFIKKGIVSTSGQKVSVIESSVLTGSNISDKKPLTMHDTRKSVGDIKKFVTEDNKKTQLNNPIKIGAVQKNVSVTLTSAMNVHDKSMSSSGSTSTLPSEDKGLYNPSQSPMNEKIKIQLTAGKYQVLDKKEHVMNTDNIITNVNQQQPLQQGNFNNTSNTNTVFIKKNEEKKQPIIQVKEESKPPQPPIQVKEENKTQQPPIKPPIQTQTQKPIPNPNTQQPHHRAITLSTLQTTKSLTSSSTSPNILPPSSASTITTPSSERSILDDDLNDLLNQSYTTDLNSSLLSFKSFFDILPSKVSTYTSRLSDTLRKRKALKHQQTFLKLINTWTTQKHNPSIKKHFYTGIPTNLRGKLWLLCLKNSFSITTELFQIHSAKAQEQSPNIDITLPFSYTNMFTPNSPLTDDLIEIIITFVYTRQDIIYQKELSSIAAILLLNLDKFQSYVALHNIVCNSILIPFYVNDEKEIKRRVGLYRQVFYMNLPELCEYLEIAGAVPEKYFVLWYKALFSGSFYIDLVMRIWDIYVVEGIKAVYTAAVALMKVMEKELMEEIEEEDIVGFLNVGMKERKVDEEMVVKYMKEVNVPQWVEEEIKEINSCGGLEF